MRKVILLAAILVFFFAPFTHATKYVIDVTNNKFTPNDIAIDIGDTVTWDFLEGSHTTTSGVSCVSNGIWDSGTKDSGTTYMRVFDSAGAFPYYCTHHCADAMVGQVRVRTSSIDKENTLYLTGSFSAYPNPFNNKSILQYELKKPAKINIQLVDLAGRVVAEINPMSMVGVNRTEIKTDDLKEGIYVARLITDGIITENKLLLKQR